MIALQAPIPICVERGNWCGILWDVIGAKAKDTLARSVPSIATSIVECHTGTDCLLVAARPWHCLVAWCKASMHPPEEGTPRSASNVDRDATLPIVHHHQTPPTMSNGNANQPSGSYFEQQRALLVGDVAAVSIGSASCGWFHSH